MNYLNLNLQIQCKRKHIPKFNFLYICIKTILDDFYKNTKINIGLQLVRKKKIHVFNKMYLQHDYVTNILAFRYNDYLKPNFLLLGDMLICHEILLKESKALNKSIIQYYALIIIHGTLHLLNFTHNNKKDEIYMQYLEKKYLKQIGF